MKVQRNTWHYKLYDFSYGGGWPPRETNLRRYFWRVMLGLLLGTVLVGFASLVVYAIGALLYGYPVVTRL